MKSRILFFFKANVRFYAFLLFCALFSGLFFTLSNYVHLPVINIKDFLMNAIHWSIIVTASACFIYLLAINKYIFAFAFPILSFINSVAAYFVFTQDLSITSGLIASVVNTNIEESASLMSIQIVLFVTFCMIITILAVIYRFKKVKVRNYPVHFILIIICLVFAYSVDRVRYNTLAARLPFSIYHGIKQYRINLSFDDIPRKDISQDAVCQTDSLTIVFILGEAARADHFAINGYNRNTSPYLSENNVFSFPNIFSQWTHTDSSVPHILTRADSANIEPAKSEVSFISFFKRCGWHTSWIGNQTPNPSYVQFINNCETPILVNQFQTVYNYKKRLDQDLLPYFDSMLMINKSRKLIVLHQIGSHWWYNTYYPKTFMKFKPVIESKNVGLCEKQNIINSYDNTILYTDFIIGQVIDRLKNKRSLMIYLADHGESLGENGKWLHAQDNPPEQRPACFVWYSTLFAEKYPDKVQAIINNKNKFYRTDFLFHSILDAGEIKTEFMKTELSIFRE